MADFVGTSGDDTLPGTAGADTISGLEGDDTLQGLEGNDELLGGDGNDLLDGGDGDDILRGGAGTNTLQGWAGNDTFYVVGNDSVTGGAGNDTLNVLNVLGTTYDGGADTDSLTLDFSAAGAGATVNLTNLWSGLNGSIGSATVSNFEAIAGTIFGSGFADSITIGNNYASALTMLLGGGNDAGIGGSGADSLSGGDANDTLQGLDGNDALSGDFGSDSLSGGEGNDTLYDSDGTGTLNGDAGDDTVTLGVMAGGSASGGAGFDYLRFDLELAVSGVAIALNATGGVVSGSLGGVSISGFESLNGFINQTTNHNDTVTLGADFNTAVIVKLLDGNDSYSGGSGNDWVYGDAGNDTLGGGAAGSDTLFGGLGNDSFLVDNATTTLNEAAGQGTDTVLASLNFALFNVENIENLTLTGFGNINGLGDAAANVITGNNGANRIEAYGGNDTVNGGNGNDAIFGMEGDDTLNGEGGNDEIEDGAGTNTINGGGGDDYITLSGDSVNTADGGIGNDSLFISKFNRTSGFVIDLTGLWSGGSGSVNGGTATGFELVIGFEGTQWADVINFGAGTTADVGINDAGAGNDVLTGTDGDNYILGGEGNDAIVSGAGTDTLLGGAGDDSITVGITTAGTVDGGAGTDTLGFVQYAFGPAVALDIDFTLLWGGGTGAFNGIAVTGIELLETDFIVGAAPFFTSGDDSVVIGAGYTSDVNMELGVGADSASGGSGNDIIDGAQDDDVLRGGAGNDTLGGSYGSDYAYGEAGNDILSGDTLDVEWAWGNDHLYGGIGNDTIEGGAYQDCLFGGAGNDVMRGDSPALGEGDHGDDLLNGGSGDDQLVGHGGADTLRGGTGLDELNGDAGEDRLHGDADADILNGRAGNDVLSGGAGADEMRGGSGDDIYYVDAAGDAVIELADFGWDTVRSGIDYVLGSHLEELIIAGAARDGTGNALDNILRGSGSSNVLLGLGGDDVFRGGGGRDTLDGGTGEDLIDGGVGKDTMTGGADRDVFQFRDGDFGPTRPLADVITDFSQADAEKIHLGLVDANTIAGGNQAFTWIGTGAFTGVAGQLHYVQQAGNTYVEGDLDGDSVADIFIALTGTIDLVAADFVL